MVNSYARLRFVVALGLSLVFAGLSFSCAEIGSSDKVEASLSSEDLNSFSPACRAIAQLLPYASLGTLKNCESPPACHEAWSQYKQCVKGSQASQCRSEFRVAQECTVCDAGHVDIEDYDQALFVNNKNPSTCGIGPGTFSSPFCKIGDALDVAIAAQPLGHSTKVVVCEGSYYEEYDRTIPDFEESGSVGRITLESVTQHSGQMKASEVPSWSEVNVTQHEYRGNLLPHSENFGTWANVYSAMQVVGGQNGPALESPGSPPQPTPGRATKLTVVSEQPDAFIEATMAPHLPARRFTFSVFVKPLVEAGRLAISLHDGLSSESAKTFQFAFGNRACPLPPSNVDEAGVVPYGNDGWYRVWVSTDFNASIGQHHGDLKARIFLRGADGSASPVGAQALVFGAQVEGLALGRFREGAGAYVATSGASLESSVPHSLSMIELPWQHNWGVDASLVLSSSGKSISATDAALARMTPIAFREEMIFHEGVPLRQELHFEDMGEGSFWVDDGITYETMPVSGSNPAISNRCLPVGKRPCRVLVRVSDVNPRKLEVSERLLTLHIRQGANWTVRGMRFAHARGDAHRPSVYFGNTSNVELVGNLVQHNASGLNVGALGDVLLSSNHVDANALLGERVTQAATIRKERVTRNNWRGHRGNWRSGTVGGTKYSTGTKVIRNSIYSDNYGHGLWLDVGNSNVEIQGGSFSNNVGTGIYLERNVNPEAIDVLQSKIEGNGVGVGISNTSDVNISDSHVLNNTTNVQLFSNADDDLGGTLHDISLTGNVFEACPGSSHYEYGDLHADDTLVMNFLKTLQSTCNQFSPAGFGFFVSWGLPNAKVFLLLDDALSAWSALTGQDTQTGPCQ